MENIHLDVEDTLSIDTIVGKQTRHTRTQTIPLFHVAKAGQIPTQGKWYPLTELEHKFPHLLR